jgi:hypothetical protein
MDFIKAIGSAVHDVVHEAREFIDSRNKITLQLNNHSFVGGDAVSGVVHLNCMVPFEAKGVVVKIKGYELAEWEEWKTEQVREGDQVKTERKLEVHKQSKEFFCDHIHVYPHSGVVQQGQYQFPFQYQLPPSLPGTFYEKGGHFGQGTGYRAEIIYFAKAKIDVRFKHDLKQKVNFVVNEKFDKMLQPSFAENSKTFMFTKGKLSARVWLDKNCYFPGNTVIAKLEANNTSVKPTNSLNVKVYKSLNLKAHHHSWHKTFEIYHSHYKGFEPSFFGVKWLPFQIPLNVQPSTTTGHHVQCRYFFVVECDIPGAIDLKIELPTAVLAPQWLFSNQPQAPPMAQLPPDISYRPPWQPDEACHSCNKCQVNFSLFKRRHHCRACGKIFCKACAHKETKITNLGYTEGPVRVCEGCFESAVSGGVQYQTAQELPVGPAIEYGAAPPAIPTAPQ